MFLVPRPAATRLLAAGLLAASAATAADKAEPPDWEATRSVAAYLAGKDCPGAVKALNAALPAKQRDVLLLAGAMFEHGLCVKPSWERASYFYQLAHNAGNRSAVLRLASGYAVAGRDNALALWWIAQRPHGMPAACIPAADPLKDAAGFEAALTGMSQSLLRSCIYITGVHATILGEAEFPQSAIRHLVYGDVEMRFVPAAGTVDFKQLTLERAAPVGLVDGRPAKEASRRQVEGSLLTYMRGVGDRALARYQKPEGIDPATVMVTHLSFAYDN